MSVDPSRVFVDTNILVYAHDRSAGQKHDRARSALNTLWTSGGGCLSIQVLQEFYVDITRKVPRPLDPRQAAEVIADLANWNMHSPTAQDMLDAIRLQQRFDVSFWDAMILTSAQVLGCPVVWSEDMNDGQRFGDLQVRNPLTV